MAEKTEKKDEKAPAEPPAEKKEASGKKGGGAGGLLSKTPVMLGIVMILEAIVLFAGFKFLGAGAKSAAGADLTTDTSHDDGSHGSSKDAGHGEDGKPAVDKKKPVVLKVTEFKAPNKKNGSTFLFDMKICLVTKGEFQ